MKAVIRHVKRESIDETKWDACISRAPNGLVYGYCTYLDAMADHWDGLVLYDYEAVMPLPWRRKYGISYLYQPPFTAQLGLFGNDVNAQLLAAFFRAVPATFKLWEFSLNHGNVFPLEGYELYQRSNFVLSLDADHNTLFNRYRENIRRNIKKARGLGCTITTSVDIAEVIALSEMQPQQSATAADDFRRFASLYTQMQEKGKAKIYGILSAEGQLLSSAVFFFSHNRAYYILVGNHPNGRTLGASHALIDAFIQDHAGSGLLLDFEGSDLRNLAFFYSSFGAAEEQYVAVRHDRLPWYIKLIRR